MWCSLTELAELYSSDDFDLDCVNDGERATLNLRNSFFSFNVPLRLELASILITGVDNLSPCTHSEFSPLC